MKKRNSGQLITYLQEIKKPRRGIDMEGIIGLIILVLFVFVVSVIFFKYKSKESSKFEEVENDQTDSINRCIATDKGQVTVKGDSLEVFDISVNDGDGNYKFKVRDGNIVEVKLPNSESYYKYME